MIGYGPNKLSQVKTFAVNEILFFLMSFLVILDRYFDIYYLGLISRAYFLILGPIYHCRKMSKSTAGFCKISILSRKLSMSRRKMSENVVSYV